MLRIDLNILWNLINIVVLFVLLRIFLFKPVNKILEARQALVEEQIRQANEAQALADSAKTEYETRLAGAEDESVKITEEARAKAEKERLRIVDQANTEADQIKEKARAEAMRETDRMRGEANEAIRDMVVDAAAKIVGAGEDAESNKKLYDRFLEQAT